MNTTTPAVNPEHNLNFSTREEYLQFVANWKQSYKELSQKIRTTKVDFKTIQRLSSITNPTEGQTQGIIAAKARSFANVPNWGREQHRKALKHEATAMLAQRAEGKVIAGILRQQRLEVA